MQRGTVNKLLHGLYYNSVEKVNMFSIYLGGMTSLQNVNNKCKEVL